LISIRTAPACFAINGKDFAGSTVLEVPIERKVSQILDTRLTWPRASCSKFSLNQTTSGRNKPLQFEQRDGKVF
jgi:hypothetical protein